jgi:hypothetical protein
VSSSGSAGAQWHEVLSARAAATSAGKKASQLGAHAWGLQMSTLRRALGTLAAFCLSVCSTDAASAVAAVWKPQQLTFSYFALTSKYACTEFEGRIRQILLVLGAHREIRIERRECSPQSGMHLQITFMSPIEATPENVRSLTSFDSQDQLIAKLRGVELPTGEDVVRFPAEWQEVSLSRDRRIGLRAGDCELLAQVQRQLVPRFATRSVPKRVVCVQGNLSSRPPPMNVAALIASAAPGR